MEIKLSGRAEILVAAHRSRGKQEQVLCPAVALSSPAGFALHLAVEGAGADSFPA